MITDVDAIHPGYGFLSENAHFAEVCESCNIRFIGPSPRAMQALSDKAVSRALAKKAGVATPPGSEGVVEKEQDAIAIAKQIGYPVMIKAVAGGGGRGMRVAHNDPSLVKGYHTARSEAETAFGPAIDFSQAYNPGQLLTGWYPPGENGAWTADAAEALLRRDGQREAAATVYVHRPFYRGPVTLRLLVDGVRVAEQTIDRTAQITLRAPLPPTSVRRGLLRVRLEVEPTFIPAEVLDTKDRTPKGVLVQRIALE